MTRRTEQISLHLNAYLTAHSSPPDAVLRELANETAYLFPNEMGLAIAPEQGTLMTLLTQLAGAVSAIEIGTFTGYSSICIARGLAEGGRLLACDVSEDWTAIARGYWRQAGVADRIDLKIAPAAETLRALPRDADSMIDFAFIDADKESYPVYYEEIVTRLRPGGLIVLDNVLLGGRVVDPVFQEAHVRAMRGLNEQVASDDRVEAVMLPLRDGVTVIRKR
jgi:caffeoyl-CoA O-methyltransferase